MSLVALFQTDIPSDFTAPTGLQTLAMYPTVVLHAEMATVNLRLDAAGQQQWARTDGASIAQELAAQGPEVWLYLNPWWVWKRDRLSGAGEWLRIAQHGMAQTHKAWMRDRYGVQLEVFDGRMVAIDARVFGYVDVLAEVLLALPIKRFFLDAGFYHQAGYHGAAGGTNEARLDGVLRLYRALRAGGAQVIANAGWEMLSPKVQPWVFPFADGVDGVGIEPPTGFKFDGAWWSLVASYGASAPDLTQMERVAELWRKMGKRVWLVARWQRSKPGYNYSPFATFAAHARFWTEAALRVSCEASVHWNVQQAPWGDWAEKATADHRPQTEMDRMANLERRVLVLEEWKRAMALEMARG